MISGFQNTHYHKKTQDGPERSSDPFWLTPINSQIFRNISSTKATVLEAPINGYILCLLKHIIQKIGPKGY